ncbi:neprilysin-1 [Drosophila elegans]|uniref:neprilysin-1 n=1 Tax=Drosophila elegans TaxID=30023 RepID=UPI0007E77CD5|nr:neprilysin-1 [Drosophila elegans]
MIFLWLRLGSTMLWGVLIYVILMDCEARSVVDTPDNNNSDNPADLQIYSDRMKSYMNLSVEPCENFYEYACGNYRNMKPDRYFLGKRSSYYDIIYTMSGITEQFLDRMDLAQTLNVSSELMVAQRFYNACMAADLYPFHAADPAYLSLIRSIGGFPAVDGAAWNASNFSWFNMSAHLTNYGASGLIREALSPLHPFEPYFRVPDLGFDHIVKEDNIASNTSRAYRLNEERMRVYLRAFQLPEDKITEVIAGVFAFWRDVLEVPAQCQEFSSSVVERLFPQSKHFYDIAFGGLHADSNSLCVPYYMELDKVCARHPEAVANYLAMQLLYKLDPKLKAPQQHRDYCTITLYISMSYLFNKLYMTDTFTEAKRLEVSEIVQELRKSLRRSLEEADWLDAETRKEALLKESTIQSRIGSLKNNALTDRIISEIGSLKIVEDSFAETNINVQRLAVASERFSSLHFEELANDTKTQKLYLGLQVAAINYRLDNSINVMPGMLEPPVYHRSWPLSLKFGTLGFIVGHELTHGFDVTGSDFDSKSQSRSWWSEKSRMAFEDRAECFINHYGKYLIPEINRHIDGKQTIDENIADNGGLRQAMMAYRSHMEQQLKEPGQEKISERMPGLDLTPDQLFFLGFTQVYCAEYEEEHYWKDLADEHTIQKYRMLGALSNSEDFFQAYDCPVGSGMRPAAKTCRLW